VLFALLPPSQEKIVADYEPVRLTRGGKTVTTKTVDEEVSLRYNGWANPKSAKKTEAPKAPESK